MSSISEISYNKFVPAKKESAPSSKDPYKFLVRFDPDIAERLNDFRHARKFESKNETINWLIDYALKQNPKR
jgi:hypothetical protein